MVIQLEKAKGKIKNTFLVDTDILIVDDGSTDKTPFILDSLQQKPNIHIIHHPQNFGYGKTLVTGFNYAIENNYAWVISFDMDGQHEPRCLYRFMDNILKADDKISLISGSRYLNPKFFWKSPWKDRFLVNCIISGVLAKFNIHVTDAFCGMKAFKVGDLKEIELTLDGYEMPLEYWMKMHQANMSFTEIAVPLIYKDRDHVQKRHLTDEEIIKNAHQRLIKYIHIINQYTVYKINMNYDQLYLNMINIYNSYKAITAENFQKIWDKINNEVIHQVWRKETHDALRCTCFKCTSRR